MPRRPTISREMYDAAIARAERAEKQYDELFESYKTLRPTHSPAERIRVTLPQPDSGQQTLQAAEQAVNDPRIRGIAENLLREKPHMGEAAALREAKRLNDIAVGRTAAPSSVP